MLAARRALIQHIYEQQEEDPPDPIKLAIELSKQGHLPEAERHFLVPYAFPKPEAGKAKWYTVNRCKQYVATFLKWNSRLKETPSYEAYLKRALQHSPELRNDFPDLANTVTTGQSSWLQAENSYFRLVEQLGTKLPPVEAVERNLGIDASIQYQSVLEALENGSERELDVEDALQQGKRETWSRERVQHRLDMLYIFADVTGPSGNHGIANTIEIGQAYIDYIERKRRLFERKHAGNIELAKGLGVWRMKSCDKKKWQQWSPELYERYWKAYKALSKSLPPNTVRYIPERRFSEWTKERMEQNLSTMEDKTT